MAKANKKAKEVVAPVEQVVTAKETTSSQIRALAAEGLDRPAIVKAMQERHGKKVIYQHVRNVLVTPLKRTVAKEA